MRILNICNHFYPNIGGVEKYVYDLCRNLNANGHRADVLCFDRKFNGKTLSHHQVVAGINIYREPSFNLRLYNIAPAIWKYLKGYDVIHIHGLGFYFDFLAAMKGIHRKPIVLSTHGGIFHTKRALFLKKLYFNHWAKRGMESIDVVFAHSVNDKKLFSRITGKGKLFLVPYSICYDDFQIRRRPVRNSMLFVGRVGGNKRVDNLLKVVARLKEKIPGVKLVVVGAKLDGSLKRMARDLGITKNVRFEGEKFGKALIKYYSRAALFVSASEYEGFGISVLEAMAAGCPVVVNNIEAFRNFVKNGKTGFMVDFNNQQKAAGVIYKLLGKDLRKIGANARNAAKAYDWKVSTRRILDIYGKLLRDG